MCKFPAQELIEYARTIALYPGDPAKIAYAAGFIQTMGELGSWHEDHTGCHCWDQACIEYGLREPEQQSEKKPPATASDKRGNRRRAS